MISNPNIKMNTRLLEGAGCDEIGLSVCKNRCMGALKAFHIAH